MVLELVPRFGLARRYTVRRDGQDVAVLRLSSFREAGQLRVDGVAHELRREGLVSGAFTLSRGGAVVARAHKPSAFRKRFEVELEGRTLEVEKAAWWGRRFDVREHGQVVGGIAPHHPFTRRAEIALPPDVGLPATVFVASLVALMWHRDAGGAAVGAGGGS